MGDLRLPIRTFFGSTSSDGGGSDDTADGTRAVEGGWGRHGIIIAKNTILATVFAGLRQEGVAEAKGENRDEAAHRADDHTSLLRGGGRITSG